MSTTNRNQTLKTTMDDANPSNFNAAAARVKLGTMLAPTKQTFTALTAAAAIDITTAASAAAASPGVDTDEELTTLPAILSVTTLRVTASGTAASVGSYIISDTGGTPTLPTGGASAGVGIATLSDDGKTLTFPNTITAFVITYIPRPSSDMTAAFPQT